MAAQLTPEEQLLKLIEEPSGGSGAATAGAGLGGGRPWWATWRQRWQGVDGQPLDIRPLTYGLWVVLVILVVYLAVDLVTPHRGRVELAVLDGAPVDAATASGTPVLADAPALPLKPLEHYLDGLQRDPFTGLSATQALAPAEEAPPVSRLESLSSSLKVVGISRGARTEALIEDGGGQKTIVAGVGDQIKGLTVTEITGDGRVTVELDGDTRELR